MGFNHSIKVPTQYKRTAAVLKTALESKKSLKPLIYAEKHANMRGMQAVLKQYADNRPLIDNAIEESNILVENPRMCAVLCKVLVTELMLGRKELIGNSKPVETVKQYRQKFANAIAEKGNLNTKTEFEPRYVRVNTNLLSLSEALQLLETEEWQKKDVSEITDYNKFLAAVAELQEFEFLIDMHVDNLLIFHPKQKFYWACHQYVKEKKFLLQDKGTCLVVELLQPTPDSTLLDMCAAPGMKTIQACNAMQNKGTIYAVEYRAERYTLLSEMVTAAGCNNVKTISADVLNISSDDCPNVEYILVDPSCSGSGMRNRMSLEPEHKDDDRLKKLQSLQIKILSHAMQSFPNVKRIAYSTCSLYEEENEQVIQCCLEQHSDFKLLSCKKALRNKWINCGNVSYKKIGKQCLYSRPETDLTDGIFVAIFEKIRDQ